ncbi:hypothetical protein Bbelb_349740 [Branchiostoma belcheri]|nr:hypothetical protein Bbelb_349740 [Branchiostoma belcheri]
MATRARAEIKLVKFSGKKTDFIALAKLQQWPVEDYSTNNNIMLHLEGPALEFAESLGDKVTCELINLHFALSDRFEPAPCDCVSAYNQRTNRFTQKIQDLLGG